MQKLTSGDIAIMNSISHVIAGEYILLDVIGNLRGTHYHKVIDISSFSNGVYLFRLIFESNTKLIKVIKI